MWSTQNYKDPKNVLSLLFVLRLRHLVTAMNLVGFPCRHQSSVKVADRVEAQDVVPD